MSAETATEQTILKALNHRYKLAESNNNKVTILYLRKKAKELETTSGDNLRDYQYPFLMMASDIMKIGNLYSQPV